MSKRKPLSQVRGHRTKAEVARRKALEATQAEATPENATTAADDPVVATLESFLADVRAARDGFRPRLRPGATVTAGAAPGDAFAVAKAYAEEVAAGNVVAGEMLKLAAKRFLADLAEGHGRGIFFDPLAAEHVCYFARQFCGLPILPWQTFVLANVFGFKLPHGGRRFKEAWLSVAKKNGKTKLASVIGLWGLICDGEQHPEVYSAATKKDQAKICWRDARHTVTDNGELAAYVKRWAHELVIGEDAGSFEALASDERSLDGLRPSFIICDEIAFWNDREQWDKLAKGVVSRIQPLVFAITTAGSSIRCFARTKFDLVEKILKGIIQDDTTFAAIYQIDRDDKHLEDETCWAKANPSLGVTLSIENLQKIRDEVKVDATGLPAWLQYHCNRWAEKDVYEAATISLARWDELARLDLIPEAKDPVDAYTRFVNMNRGKHVWAGLDLGKVNDMTAVAYLWRTAYLNPHVRDSRGQVVTWADEMDLHFLLVDYFMPEVGLLDKEKKWGVPLTQWVKEGWITLLPGDLIDDHDIEQQLRVASQGLFLMELGFDRWQAETICGRLTAEKIISCIAVPQMPSTLTQPARELMGDIRRGKIVHFGNPVLRWNIENVVLAEDDHGGIRPRKANADDNRKIDGIAAALNAYTMMLKAPAPISAKVYSL